MPLSYEKMVGRDADVSLFAAYNLPYVRFNNAVVSTIHDLILFKVTPEDKKIADDYKKRIRHAVNVSDSIITVSNSSKNDLINILNVPEDKITVAYNGVDFNRFNTKISVEKQYAVRHKYKLPQHFMLYFGTYRRHKNIENMVKAYSMLDKSYRDYYKLVITNGNPNIIRYVNELGIQDDVTFTGFIDDEDKVALYQLADISLYVSLYEGFGIPIIEAMAAGTPVITSNTSSMPEAAGEAATLVDPYSPEEISSAMIKLIDNRDYYNCMINKGFQNAKKIFLGFISKGNCERFKTISVGGANNNGNPHRIFYG